VHSAGADGSTGALPSTRLARLIALMREEALDEASGAASVVDHLSAALFALALRFASAADDPPRGILALAARPRLLPAVAAIFEEPGQPWTLGRLAAICHMSRASFVRHFEDAIGQSAAEVLTDVRMTIASRQLKQTELSVAAIGEAVGYQSEAAFQRAFKRRVGVTPASWRSNQSAERWKHVPRRMMS
jgi:AraC family transcriptional activator of mtrCDE